MTFVFGCSGNASAIASNSTALDNLKRIKFTSYFLSLESHLMPTELSLSDYSQVDVFLPLRTLPLRS